MPDWIDEHRTSIEFVLFTIVGLGLLIVGLIQSDPAMVALGAGAMGLPGFHDLARKRVEKDERDRDC